MTGIAGNTTDYKATNSTSRYAGCLPFNLNYAVSGRVNSLVQGYVLNSKCFTSCNSAVNLQVVSQSYHVLIKVLPNKR